MTHLHVSSNYHMLLSMLFVSIPLFRLSHAPYHSYLSYSFTTIRYIVSYYSVLIPAPLYVQDRTTTLQITVNGWVNRSVTNVDGLDT